MERSGGFARLGPVAELDLRPVFQPIVDLRDGAVVGYEALMRSGPEDGELHSARAMLEAARREDSIVALDHAARDAAIAHADSAGLGAPFCLFLNADAVSLEGDVPLPDSSLTLIMDVTERALIERPEAVLRALTELRTHGWGIALDDVGADSRSLALTSVLYPDVIKLDLRLLDDRSLEDVARIVMAVGAEAERRHAVILAGVDEQGLERAVRRFGWLQERVAFVGVLNAGGAFDGSGVRSGALAPADPLRGTGTVVTLAPDFAACYVAREAGEGWEWAISYDRETVVECALQLIARMEPLA